VQRIQTTNLAALFACRLRPADAVSLAPYASTADDPSELGTPARERRPSRLPQLCGWGAAAAAILAIAPIRPAVVQGKSMEPSLEPGSVVFYNTHTEPGDLRRGDVVLIRARRELWIKRVFAVAGDRYWRISIKGRPDESIALLAGDEPVGLFRSRFPALDYSPRRVPPGHVFVLGDAPGAIDSRMLGPIPCSEMVGKALLPSIEPADVCVHVKSFSTLPPEPRRRRHTRLALRTGD